MFFKTFDHSPELEDDSAVAVASEGAVVADAAGFEPVEAPCGGDLLLLLGKPLPSEGKERAAAFAIAKVTKCLKMLRGLCSSVYCYRLRYDFGEKVMHKLRRLALLLLPL